MRKLATVQKITSMTDIPGADKIAKATVLGWEVVVQKSEFKEGQLVVYVEVDSILPPRPEFEFLRERKFRIKTIRLRGQVSQGICFPMSILKNKYGYREGADVTEELGITKYDPEAELEKKEMDAVNAIHKNRMDKFMKRYAWYRRFIFKPKKKPFPAFIKKTDEPRVQLFPRVCEEKRNSIFAVTEKVDGQSATYFCIKNRRRRIFSPSWIFGVASRNFELHIPDNSTYWTIANSKGLKDKMLKYCTKHGCDLVIQGEIAGNKVQGNKYAIKDLAFFVFNVIITDKDGNKNVLNAHDINYVCSELGLETVPFIKYMYLPRTIAELVEESKGKSTLNASVPREGIVVRSDDGRVSFKVINPDFLLKYDL